MSRGSTSTGVLGRPSARESGIERQVIGGIGRRGPFGYGAHRGARGLGALRLRGRPSGTRTEACVLRRHGLTWPPDENPTNGRKQNLSREVGRSILQEPSHGGALARDHVGRLVEPKRSRLEDDGAPSGRFERTDGAREDGTQGRVGPDHEGALAARGSSGDEGEPGCEEGEEPCWPNHREPRRVPKGSSDHRCPSEEHAPSVSGRSSPGELSRTSPSSEPETTRPLSAVPSAIPSRCRRYAGVPAVVTPQSCSATEHCDSLAAVIPPRREVPAYSRSTVRAKTPEGRSGRSVTSRRSLGPAAEQGLGLHLDVEGRRQDALRTREYRQKVGALEPSVGRRFRFRRRKGDRASTKAPECHHR